MHQGPVKPWLRRYETVESFYLSTDVVVCGYGGAGASAALEARRAGADVLVLERAYSFPLAPWVITLSRVRPDAGNTGKVMEATQIVRFDSTQGWWIQNFEGLTRHRGNCYFMVSDDGGHAYLQTQLLYFEIR